MPSADNVSLLCEVVFVFVLFAVSKLTSRPSTKAVFWAAMLVPVKFTLLAPTDTSAADNWLTAWVVLLVRVLSIRPMAISGMLAFPNANVEANCAATAFTAFINSLIGPL